jgi:TolB-like protein/DNA-binding winged helix-turn-helix (wHTH) protein/Tfp pilus assembly protein PilF
VDAGSGELRHDGQITKLQDKPLRVLLALLMAPGRVITREELRRHLWSADTFVEFDDGLNHAVRKLREALGDSADKPRFIETLPRHGYRFMAPVEPIELPPALAVQRRPLASLVRRGLSHRIWIIVLGVSIAVAVFSVWHSRPGRSDSSARLMLAVLPLANLSGDREQEFLAEGVTEEIINELGRLNPDRLGVIARTSVVRFATRNATIREIGTDLGVDYVVEGGVRMSGQQLRVTVQLIRVSDQTHVWAEAYEGTLENVLAFERSVAEQTARVLSLRLLPAAQQRLAAAKPVSREAQEAYLRGRFLLGKRTAVALRQARDQFQKAIELEPKYAQAYSGLAVVYVLLPNYQAIRPREGAREGKAACLKALELDPSLTEARTVLAEIHSELEWDFKQGEAEFRRALDENPNFAVTHRWYAAYLWAMGRFDEAIQEVRKAAELDPLSLGTATDVGRAHYFAREFDLAIRQYRQVLELDSGFSAAHSLLGLALLEKKEYDAAIAELQKGISATGGQSVWLAYAYAIAGRTTDARKELAGCLQRWNRSHAGGICLSLGHAGLGEYDQAFTWLEREFEERTSTIYMLKAYPYWDRLRTDPRYENLLRRAGLPL